MTLSPTVAHGSTGTVDASTPARRQPAAPALAPLPLEVREHVVAYLPPRDVVSLARTDRAWAQACTSSHSVGRLFEALPPGAKLAAGMAPPAAQAATASDKWRVVGRHAQFQRQYALGARNHYRFTSQPYPAYLRFAECCLPGERGAFSPDSAYVVLRGGGGAQRAVHAIIPRPFNVLPALNLDETPTSISFAADGRSVLTFETLSFEATLWRISRGVWTRQRKVASPQGTMLEAAQLAPGGARVVLETVDEGIEVHDLNHPHKAPIDITTQLSYDASTLSTDGRWLVLYTVGGEVEVWDIGDASASVRRLVMPQNCCDGVALSPTGRHLVVTQLGGECSIIDVTAATLTAVTLDTPTGSINSIDFSVDGRLLVLTYGGAASIFDLEDAQHPRLHRFAGYQGVHGAALSPDGDYVAIAALGTTHLFCLDGPQAPILKLPSDTGTDSICFSPDGRYVLQTAGGGTTHLWDFGAGA